jgi:CheY-like chemotaxis protein
MGTQRRSRPRILIAHKDAVWVDQAKQRLEAMGYSVTECLEPEWAVDLLAGSRPYSLAAVTSELDPSAQAAILKLVKEGGTGTKILLLLDELDSASMMVSRRTGMLTHRIAKDNLHDFAVLVAAQVGPAPRNHDA